MKMICYFYILFLAVGAIFFGACEHSSDKLVDSQKSPFYYITKRNEIVYKYKESIAGIPLGWKRTKLDADAKTFAVLSETYAKDKNNAYYIKNKFDADVESLVFVGSNYCKDKNNVYYKSIKITNADAASFDVKDSYARDKNHVFSSRFSDESNGKLAIINDANPDTYTKLGYGWSKDDLHYYYQDEKTDVDVHTFRLLTKNVGIDKESIYYFAGKPSAGHARSQKYEGEVHMLAKNVWYDNKTIYNFRKLPASFIPVKNPATIQLIDTTGSFVFFVDNVLYWNMIEKDTQDIDIATFKCDGNYATDKNRVYYSGTVIEGADKNTFEKIDQSFSKDKDNVYYLWNILPKADPATFKYVIVKNRPNHYEDKNYKWQYNNKEKAWQIME